MKKKGITSLDLDMAVVEERADDVLEELTGNTVDNVSFVVRDKRLELLSSKLIFAIFTFLGYGITLSLGCDDKVEVEIISDVSCNGCDEVVDCVPMIVYFYVI